MRVVLAVDPGQEKCGLAVVSEQGLIEKQIISSHGSANTILSIADQHRADSIIIGDGTGSAKIKNELMSITQIPIIVIPEAYTTIKARKRYFADNPRKGIWRLVPLGLLVPEQPYDDYAALIIAETYLEACEHKLS
ncbi:MAG: RuvC family protein [Armatimonadota bacterium]